MGQKGWSCYKWDRRGGIGIDGTEGGGIVKDGTEGGGIV